mmetsp:Transcript_24992/g.36941  ORF Transcript_24992/g.36941 Transcript_24992/m.36941 type:complete len:512 (-) Transcript_24992:318-1853(-)
MSNATGQPGASQPDVMSMELTEDSMLERQKHERLLVDLEAKKRAFSIEVPTLPQDVRHALRNLRLPVRLFGENLANIRDRLRMELARREIMKEGGVTIETTPIGKKAEMIDQEEEVTKYTRASTELVKAREKIAKFSFSRAKERLERERRLRAGGKRKRDRLLLTSSEDSEIVNDNEAEVSRLDDSCTTLYKSLRNVGLEGSQYGDGRALSAICTFDLCGHAFAATGSWSATVKLWDASSPDLVQMGIVKDAHEDRIMGVDAYPFDDFVLCATASIDLTGKLWKVARSEDAMTDEDTSSMKYAVSEVASLKGHKARLSSTSFHPMGEHVATTSFDHSWRLWDVETGSQLLLQDGHAREVYGVGFHPDGSIVATTDFCSVVQNWDLRSGKSICHHQAHAKRVLCAEFSPNGFQLATAGDDGTIKVFDMRQRKIFASIPAHSRLISQLRFSHSATKGEYLASSSFDATAKLWSTRDWRILSTLKGHEGKVMGIGLTQDGIITSGYDKTIKLWK